MARNFARGEDAEDLAGETVLRLFLHRRDFGSVEELRSFCYVVMRNVHYSLWQRRKVIGFVSLDDDFDEPLDSYDGFGALVARERLAVVQFLRRYASVDTAVLYAMGFSYAEIGEMLHLPIGTVQSRIHAGRRILRTKGKGQRPKSQQAKLAGTVAGTVTANKC
jgi:RNA polymerase sigma-70 factor (ECF subfamily)